MSSLKWFFAGLAVLALVFLGYTKISGNISKQEEGKTVLLAILARNKAHVLPTYLRCIDNQDYNKKLISVYIDTNNNEDDTQKILEDWANQNRNKYRSITFESHEEQNLGPSDPHGWTPTRFKVLAKIRNNSLKKALDEKVDYYFVVDCDNFIAPTTLSYLVKKQKPIIAPMLTAIPEQGDAYTNFFYALNPTGHFGEHPNFYNIQSRKMIGTFKVPVVHCTYLIDSAYIPKLTYIDGSDEYEFLIFSKSARENDIDQFFCNERYFGTLVHFFNDNKMPLQEEARRWKEAYDKSDGKIIGFSQDLEKKK